MKRRFKALVVTIVAALLIGAAQYYPYAASLDGSNDYLYRTPDFVGDADSKKGIVSGWFKFGNDGSNLSILANSGNYFYVFRSSANYFQVTGKNGAAATILSERSTTAYTISSGWTHFLLSFDLAGPTVYMYVNDVSDKTQIAAPVNDLIDYTQVSYAVGAQTGGAAKFNGAMSEFYFAPNQYLDISIEANRRKFITADLKPVNLGADGSTPTGVAPVLYVKKGWPTGVNSGTGGNFSAVNGVFDKTPGPHLPPWWWWIVPR